MTVPLCASCPAPQGMSQGWAHPLPLGCGHWVHTSCSRAENIPFPVLPKGPRESGLVWGRKMGMQRKWAEGPKGDTSTRGLLARRHVKPSHQVQTRGGRRPSGKSSAASGATSRHGAAGDPLQPLRGCARGGPHPVTSLWSSCVRPRPHGFGPRWTCRRLGCLPWCPHRFGERGILPGKRRTLGQAGARLRGVLGLVLALGRPGRRLGQDELPFHMSLRPGCPRVRAIASQVQVEAGESG